MAEPLTLYDLAFMFLAAGLIGGAILVREWAFAKLETRWWVFVLLWCLTVGGFGALGCLLKGDWIGGIV